MTFAALAGLLAFAQDPAPERPVRPFAELAEAYTKLYEGAAGFRAQGAAQKVFRDGSGGCSASAGVILWMRDSEETPRGVLWTERERPGDAQELNIVTLIRPAEATIVYVEEQLAYVLDLSRPRNTPWSWYFLTGPTAELQSRFEVRVVRSPSAGAVAQAPTEGDEHESSGGTQSQSAGALSPGAMAAATLSDPFAEDAWILSLRARDRALRDEISEFTVWLRSDSLLPYRLLIATASEELTVQLAEFVPVDRYPEGEFAVNIEGLDVRRR